ncbi:MAG: hypothetical protein IAE82_11010 [Opitutaceae bacterium]|nr:hypothetical protein [Opitutaceae bacterium]
MSRLKLSLLVALGSFLVTAGALVLFGRSRAAEAAQLRDANSKLRFEAIRRHATAPDTPAESAPAPTVPQAESPRPSGPTPAAAVVVDDYRNEGTATPAAAMQTFAWAGDQGDAAAVQRLITFDPAARTKALAYLETLPAEIRAQVTSPEQMAAAELTADMIQHPFPRASMLERIVAESATDERVVYRLPGPLRDRTVFQHTADGWKYVITEPMVDLFLAQRTKH